MKVRHLVRVLWSVVVVYTHVCTGEKERDRLSQLQRVAVDKSRMVELMTVRSVFAQFENSNPIWVQLWRNATDENAFVLDWQVKLQPSYGNGSLEVIDLSQDHYINIQPDHRIGMVNDIVPGPLDGLYRYGVGVVLSFFDKKSLGFPLTEYQTYEFDDLELPYHIPLYLCNETGCPQADLYEEIIIITSPAPDPPPKSTASSKPRVTAQPISSGSSTDSILLSREMMIGLIVWNIVMTLLIFIIILVLMCVCADLEKRKKERSRLCREQRRSREVSVSPSGTLSGSGWHVGTADFNNSDKEQLAESENVMVY